MNTESKSREFYNFNNDLPVNTKGYARRDFLKISGGGVLAMAIASTPQKVNAGNYTSGTGSVLDEIRLLIYAELPHTGPVGEADSIENVAKTSALLALGAGPVVVTEVHADWEIYHPVNAWVGEMPTWNNVPKVQFENAPGVPPESGPYPKLVGGVMKYKFQVKINANPTNPSSFTFNVNDQGSQNTN